MERKNTYLLNRLFTIPYIDRMISSNCVKETFYQCTKQFAPEDISTHGDAISGIYHYMESKYRNEYFFKNSMLNQLLINNHNFCDTSVLSELPIGESKADFVMINGRGTVYEIKTDLDDLSRLKSQIEDYYKVFSYVYVVVGEKQLDHVRKELNEEKVGICELTSKCKIVQRRKAYCNRNSLSHEAMFQLLRKYEFEKILKKHYNVLPNVNDFTYYRECLRWVKKMNIITLQKEVMQCLKARVSKGQEDFIDVPYELSYYAYFSKLVTKDNNYLQSFLCKTMGE